MNSTEIFLLDVVVASVVPDSKYAKMYRVQLPNGHLTDMANYSRARDAARSLALKAMTEEVAAPPMRQNRD
jgi:hypothetical protein